MATSDTSFGRAAWLVFILTSLVVTAVGATLIREQNYQRKERYLRAQVPGPIWQKFTSASLDRRAVVKRTHASLIRLKRSLWMARPTAFEPSSQRFLFDIERGDMGYSFSGVSVRGDGTHEFRGLNCKLPVANRRIIDDSASHASGVIEELEPFLARVNDPIKMELGLPGSAVTVSGQLSLEASSGYVQNAVIHADTLPLAKPLVDFMSRSRNTYNIKGFTLETQELIFETPLDKIDWVLNPSWLPDVLRDQLPSIFSLSLKPRFKLDYLPKLSLEGSLNIDDQRSSIYLETDLHAFRGNIQNAWIPVSPSNMIRINKGTVAFDWQQQRLHLQLDVDPASQIVKIARSLPEELLVRLFSHKLFKGQLELRLNLYLEFREDLLLCQKLSFGLPGQDKWYKLLQWKIDLSRKTLFVGAPLALGEMNFLEATTKLGDFLQILFFLQGNADESSLGLIYQSLSIQEKDPECRCCFDGEPKL